MAERRMFAKTIVDSDAFLDMPLSTQALYFHLSMRADDEGFINNPKKIQRMIGCGDDDLKLLMAKKFILVFDSGVIVIKHWKIHNYIQKDRFKPTLYDKEKAQIGTDGNKSYTFREQTVSTLDTEEKTLIEKESEPCIQEGYALETQVRLGKDRLGKDRVVVNKEIFDYYEQNGFGSITHKTMQDFEYWVEDFVKVGATEENARLMIIHALGKAIDNNVRKYSYVNSILVDWERNRFVSVEQIDAEDKKNVKPATFVRKEELPDWASGPTDYSANKSEVTDEDLRRFLEDVEEDEEF